MKKLQIPASSTRAVARFTSRVPWRRARPAVEAVWGAGCVAGAAALLAGKTTFVATSGFAAFADMGVLANLALLGGGAMFLREARKHVRAIRPDAHQSRITSEGGDASSSTG